jgi:hypothetical protein
MEDLILALLSAVGDLLLEVLFQWIAEAFTAYALQTVRKVDSESRNVHPLLEALGYLSLGVSFGVVSVLLFPHPFFHPTKVHGISLVISPLITGLIMSRIGLARRRKGEDTVRIESFGYGFTFALGMAAIRFFFAV